MYQKKFWNQMHQNVAFRQTPPTSKKFAQKFFIWFRWVETQPQETRYLPQRCHASRDHAHDRGWRPAGRDRLPWATATLSP